MATSAEDVYAAGDCAELPHGLTRVGVSGLTGSHAYAQGKVAGFNAGGGARRYQPVYVPWGTAAGKWVIGGASFGETLATALGIPFVVGRAQGISRARYYPGAKTILIKLLAEPEQLRLIGAQMVGQEGIKERADFLATAVKFGLTLQDLAAMENVYSPAIGALNEPIVLAAQDGVDAVTRAADVSLSRWLRNNAEHHLLVHAQDRVGRLRRAPAARPHGPGGLFWLRVFVPAYAVLPWSWRIRVLRAMPGSHRQEWDSWTHPPHRRKPAV